MRTPKECNVIFCDNDRNCEDCLHCSEHCRCTSDPYSVMVGDAPERELTPEELEAEMEYAYHNYAMGKN